jgi:putative endonuclease
MASDRLETGKWGEAEAAKYLQRRGYRILEKRWRYGRGEIDLIARVGRVLVFVEVRARTQEETGMGLYYSIGRRKWGVLRRTALAYARGCSWKPEALRYDVVGIERGRDGSLGQVHHWQDVGAIGDRVRL